MACRAYKHGKNISQDSPNESNENRAMETTTETDGKKTKRTKAQHHFLEATTEIKSGHDACHLRKCKKFHTPTHLNPRKITDFSVLEQNLPDPIGSDSHHNNWSPPSPPRKFSGCNTSGSIKLDKKIQSSPPLPLIKTFSPPFCFLAFSAAKHETRLKIYKMVLITSGS